MRRRLCTLGPDHASLWVYLGGYPVGDEAKARQVPVGALVEETRRVSMGQQEDMQEFTRISERILSALENTMTMERARAEKDGVPGDTFLQAAVNSLLEALAFTACNAISPESDPSNKRVQARIDRVHGALSDALHRILESEWRTGQQRTCMNETPSRQGDLTEAVREEATR